MQRRSGMDRFGSIDIETIWPRPDLQVDLDLDLDLEGLPSSGVLRDLVFS